MPAGGPDLEGVTIEVMVSEAPLTIHLDGAWLDDGGAHGVGAEARVPPDLVITADRSSWAMNAGTVVFEGNVRAVREPVTLTSDRLEVSYDETRVRTAIALGNVRVARGDRVAASERAVLSADDGRVELTGAPSVTDGPRLLTGERITLYLDEERLECEKCVLVVEGRSAP